MKRTLLIGMLAIAADVLTLASCAQPVTFTASDMPSDDDLGKGLPKGFLWGTATAAHQIEGGNSNDWTDWEATSFPDGGLHIKRGDTSEVATRSWEVDYFDQDLAAMKDAGATAYRFSVEWSRLEPTRGAWNADAANRYKSMAHQLRQNGIEPMVTLFHFTLPKWVAANGGFENPDTIEDFAHFATRVAILLGDDVDLWCTVNEPNVYADQSYIEGKFPPGKKDTKAATIVLANLLEAHARAAAQIRSADTVDADGDGKAALLGLAHHVRVFQAASSSSLDTTITGLTDDYFNEAVVRAAATGRIHLLVPGTIEIDRQIDGLKGSFDYLGINYYTRDHVRADLSDPSLSKKYVPDGRPTNDLGWDLYPEGLYQFLKRFNAYGWPIYITENGIADAAGDVRPDFLRAHVHAIEKAVAEGVDVRGYFHWSLMDNFEWAEGYGAKFGLYSIDRSNPELPRTETPAVGVFRKIGANIPR